MILRTTNGGATWTQSAATTTEWLYGVDFVDSLHGFITGTNGLIWRTYDGGLTWAPLPSGTGASLFDVSFVSQYEGWAVGNGGIVVHTENGGNSWGSQSTGTSSQYLHAVSFLDGARGIATGFDMQAHGIVMTTSDGGTTWSKTSSRTWGLRGVDYVASGKKWAVGRGTIITTHLLP